jgi:hypothetical protein
MMTSALALSQIFTQITMDHGRSKRFLSVAADALALSGEDREAEALLYISRSIRRVRADIESLPFPDEQKSLLISQISVFSPIADFSHASLSLEQALGNSLAAKNLVGLTHIHMALSGFVREPEVNQTIRELAQEFRDTRDEVMSSRLPDNIKKLMLVRINQIAAVLDHFSFFGVDDLEKELANLAGSLIFEKPVLSEESPNLGQKLLRLVTRGLKVIETANKSVDQGQTAVENGKEIYKMLEGLF